MKIYWVTTRRHGYTINRHLAKSPSIREIVNPIDYHRLALLRDPAVYVLSDIERLSHSQRMTLAQKSDWLTRQGALILNHPLQVHTRCPLLRTLASQGGNRFQVYRASDCDPQSVRYPAFLRCENDHKGARSELLHSPQELRAAIEDQSRTRMFFVDELGKRRLIRLGWRRRRDLLVTELCETADADGVYRKYGAFCLGQQIVARHLFFGNEWMVKSPKIITPQRLAEETRYVAENPHEKELREIFQAVGIEYGRVDYGVLDGRIQVWEINTNPMITVPDEKIVERNHIHEAFGERFNLAITSLAASRNHGQRAAA